LRAAQCPRTSSAPCLIDLASISAGSTPLRAGFPINQARIESLLIDEPLILHSAGRKPTGSRQFAQISRVVAALTCSFCTRDVTFARRRAPFHREPENWDAELCPAAILITAAITRKPPCSADGGDGRYGPTSTVATVGPARSQMSGSNKIKGLQCQSGASGSFEFIQVSPGVSNGRAPSGARPYRLKPPLASRAAGPVSASA
jgi:hypothetical protein